jgi:DNA-binding GntR family transcriptional regulator
MLMQEGSSVRHLAVEGAALPSAVETIAAAIKADIREGRIVPGQRLAEPDLIKRFGLSRGSVREALQRLMAEGIVDLERFRGARVRRLSREDVLGLNLIRAALEGVAAGQAALSLGEEGRAALAALEAEWDRTAAGLDADDPRLGWRYGKYNDRFHDLVIALSGQRHLHRFVAQTQLALIRLEFSFMLEPAAQVRRSRAQHRDIVTAILAGDAPAAEARMREHVHSTAETILSAPDSYFS